MAELMSPEEAAKFVEKSNVDFANRYSDKDPDYVQVSSNVGKSVPPLIVIDSYSGNGGGGGQRDYHHNQRNHHGYHQNNHHHQRSHSQHRRDDYRRY